MVGWIATLGVTRLNKWLTFLPVYICVYNMWLKHVFITCYLNKWLTLLQTHDLTFLPVYICVFRTWVHMHIWLFYHYLKKKGISYYYYSTSFKIYFMYFSASKGMFHLDLWCFINAVSIIFIYLLEQTPLYISDIFTISSYVFVIKIIIWNHNFNKIYDKFKAAILLTYWHSLVSYLDPPIATTLCYCHYQCVISTSSS